MTGMSNPDLVSVERVIPVPAEKVFALLSDPRRHAEIDGSGDVVETRGEAPERLHLGSEFGMDMKHVLPYAMKSRVIEYDENRRIAWQTVPVYPGSGLLVGGRIWRYELEPVEGGTLVRESWDITHEAVFTKPTVRAAAGRTRTAMEKTLERLEQLLAEEAAQAAPKKAPARTAAAKK
jgi:uncharacterized protein YndB with AHSA1/START domain